MLVAKLVPSPQLLLAAAALCGTAITLGAHASSVRAPVPVITPFPFNTIKTEQEMAFADDGTMVFCSANPDTAVAADDELDIYTSQYNAVTRTFSEAVNMGLGINSAPDPTNPLRNGLDIEPYISPDGNRLYFRSNRLAPTPDACAPSALLAPLGPTCVPNFHTGGLDTTLLFLSVKGADGTWSTPEPLPAPINTGSGEHCVMELRDGETLCFSSLRPGGFGGMDVWCAPVLEHGKAYGTPVNVGPGVNTAGMEFHFAQHPTNGHVSFTRIDATGETDIWNAQPDGEGGWLPATRLAINTPGAMDACPAWAPGGKTLFWFSMRADLSIPGAEPLTMDIFSADVTP